MPWLLPAPLDWPKNGREAGSRPAAVDSYRTPVEIDPFSVSKKEKLELLLTAMRKCGRRNRGLLKRRAPSISAARKKIFADTEGSYIHPGDLPTGGGIKAFAADGRAARYAAIPIASGGILPQRATNYQRYRLVENAAQAAREARRCFESRRVSSGRFDLVIGSSQMMLQIHESVGHAIELDRVFGYEAGLCRDQFP